MQELADCKYPASDSYCLQVAPLILCDTSMFCDLWQASVSEPQSSHLETKRISINFTFASQSFVICKMRMILF